MDTKGHMQGVGGKKCGASEGIAAVWANVPIVAEMLGIEILPASTGALCTIHVLSRS